MPSCYRNLVIRRSHTPVRLPIFERVQSLPREPAIQDRVLQMVRSHSTGISEGIQRGRAEKKETTFERGENRSGVYKAGPRV